MTEHEHSPHNTLKRTCTMCNQTISLDAEFYGFGAKARPDLDLEDKEGEFVSLTLSISGKTIFAVVPPDGSPVKESGYDLLFLTCSEECAQELKYALELDRDVFEN